MKCGTVVQPQYFVVEGGKNMVNTQALCLAISESGKTKIYLARRMGRTYQTLCNKINNRTQFTGAEVEFLCNELNIDNQDKYSIFFADKVE